MVLRRPDVPPRAPCALAPLLASLTMATPALAWADATPASLETVTVLGHYDTAIGSGDSASQGSVTANLLANRPTLRPAEVLEFVPGLIVTQHSGDGKANQYFLRGFNLDHGTDFASFVDGMPVNMPSHAHGQGYSDLNWLIPELVNRIDYRKGPYFADDGDFASAGSARIALRDRLPQGIASTTIGEHGYRRGLIADSGALFGGDALVALEAASNDGPWRTPERFRRLNGVLRLGFGDADARSTLTLMAYSARWNATDQIPLRAVLDGRVDRFGAVDPTDGGSTQRVSLSFRTQRRYDDGVLRVDAYALRSHLDLFSDFTYNLDHPSPPFAPNGDQFEQAEQRRVLGASIERTFDTHVAERDGSFAVGAQVRDDRLDPVGLYDADGRMRTGTVQEARVHETSLGLYAHHTTSWTPWLRSIVGVRHDRFWFDVRSSIDANSGTRNASITSPKLSLVFGPWAKTEAFANAGWGFHSNDARGVTETVTPKERVAADASPPLVRTRGEELGVRSELIPGLQSSLAWWRLTLASELVFSGDAGDTQPSGASTRRGVEFSNHLRATSWLLIDADLAWSRARFEGDQGSAPNLGRFVPGSVERVASLGATVTARGPWFGHLQWRYFGPRALIEDNSQRSSATMLAYLRVGYRVSPTLSAAVDVFNLFDRKASDVDYFYASRLPGEANAIDDVHVHPVEPRSVRITLTAQF